MLGLAKTRTARAAAAASQARSQVVYQRYAAALYRQALLAPDEDDAGSRLAESIVRRSHQLVTGLAQLDRRRGRRPAWGAAGGVDPGGVDPGGLAGGAPGPGTALGLRALGSLPGARRYAAMRKM
jgi:hypothetical protein